MTNLNCILFAENTSLWTKFPLGVPFGDSGKRPFQIKIWFDHNTLSMNLNKSKCIIFGNRKIEKPIKIKINHIEMERVCNTKFLGVYIDDKLNWKLHIN